MLHTIFVPRANIPHAPLTKLACDNIYPHCSCTNKISLCSVNTTHTTHTIIMRAPTSHISIMHAPLNTHHAMLNSMHTSMTHYFLCITTLHRTTPNLSAETRVPIFFVHYHFAPRNTKFKCAHPCTNLSHALILYTVHCQNLNARSHTSFFSTHPKIFTAHHAFLVHTPAHIPFDAHQFLVTSIAEIGAFAKIFPIFTIDILQL
jgi:hypothetical protein